MKPFGLRAEQREIERQHYGGYCQKARAAGLEPLSYTTFKDCLGELFDMGLSRKKRMEKLIDMTRELEEK